MFDRPKVPLLRKVIFPEKATCRLNAWFRRPTNGFAYKKKQLVHVISHQEDARVAGDRDRTQRQACELRQRHKAPTKTRPARSSGPVREQRIVIITRNHAQHAPAQRECPSAGASFLNPRRTWGCGPIPVQNASRRGDSRRLQSGATANRSRCRRWNFPPAQIAVLFQFIRIG